MIKLDTKAGLTNSQAYRTVETTLKEIDFEQRFKKLCAGEDRGFSEVDLSALLTDIITHYRNRRTQDFGEDFWL